jgi:hypothetical protein
MFNQIEWKWMKRRRLFCSVFGVMVLFILNSCSTTHVNPHPPLQVPVVHVLLPHPNGSSIEDVDAIFTDKAAPPEPSFALTCDGRYKKLLSLSQTLDELQEGTKELVRENPVHFHWCFYAKLSRLEVDVKNESFFDEREKMVLEVFNFLTPVARIFASEYHDYRYIKIAIKIYHIMSQWVFMRHLEMTPQGITELDQIPQFQGVWRKAENGFPVLEKYKILELAP